MDGKNPYDDGVFPDQPAQAPASNPYDVLPTPLGPDTSVIVKASTSRTVRSIGRADGDDALTGIPDTITMVQRGLSSGFNKGLDYLTGEKPRRNENRQYPTLRRSFARLSASLSYRRMPASVAHCLKGQVPRC